MNRVVCAKDELDEIMQIYRDENIYFVGGGVSIFVPSEQTKYMVNTATRPWPDLDGEFLPMTAGEAARTELRREYPDHKRTGFTGNHMKLFDFAPALHHTGTYQGEMYHLDISAFYATVLRRFCIDDRYPRGKGYKPLLNVMDRLWHWKGARNAIPGIIRSKTIQAFKDGRIIEVRANNSWLAPSLWANIQAVSHDIACYALMHGCIYIATDGYIFPSIQGGQEFELWLNSYGFQSRGNGGYGEIKRWGAYSSPLKETKSFRKAVKYEHHFSKITCYSERDKDAVECGLKSLQAWSKRPGDIRI